MKCVRFLVSALFSLWTLACDGAMQIDASLDSPVAFIEAMSLDPVSRVAYIGTGRRVNGDQAATGFQYFLGTNTFGPQRSIPSTGWIGQVSLDFLDEDRVFYANFRGNQNRGVFEIDVANWDNVSYPNVRRWYESNTQLRCMIIEPVTKMAYLGFEYDYSGGRLGKMDTQALREDQSWSYTSFASSSRVRSGVIDASRQILWLGTSGSLLYRVDIAPQFKYSPLSSQVTSTNVGVGNTYCLAVDEARDLLFIGQNNIGVLYRSSTIEFLKIFFVPETSLLSVVLDVAGGVSYWGTDTGKILRVNYAPGDFAQVYDILDIQCALYSCSGNPRLFAGFLDSASNFLYFAVSSNPSKLVKVQPTDCGQFSTCSTCLQGDPNYCGWCSVSNACSQLSECPLVWVKEEATCPSILSIAPTSGSTSGQTTVSITAVNVVLTNLTKCRFGSTDTPIQSITNGKIQCHTSPNAKGTQQVSIVYNGEPITNSIPFNYYDCGSSCRSCFSALRLECGWCFAEGECESATSCGDPSSFITNPASFTCPELLCVSPPSGPSTGGVGLTVNGNGFTETGNYACHFGNITSIPAVRTSVTQISCNLPSLQTQKNQYVDISIFRNGANFAGNPLSFYVYDCQSNQNCGSCLQPLAGCQYCADFTCASLGGQCEQPQTNRSLCSELNILLPASGHILGGTNVTVQGTSFGSESITLFSCLFGNVSVGAQWISSTQLSCISPPSLAGSALVKFQIMYQQVPFTVNSLVFEYYECTNFGVCSSCTPNLECVWCETGSCQFGNCDSELEEVVLCPSISSLEPNYGPPSGLPSMIVNGPIFLEAEYTCVFAERSINQTEESPATWISEQQLECPVPSHGIGFVDVFIQLNGEEYSDNSMPFEYYDCSGGLDCLLCAANPSSRCGWCRDTEMCDTIGTCLSWSTDSCPAIISVDPLNSDISGGRTVELEGSLFSSNLDLSCTFGNRSSPAVIKSDSLVSCMVPETDKPGLVSVSLTHNGMPYSYNTPPFQFEYVDCNAETKLSYCTSCVGVKELNSACGWCLDAPGCFPVGSCALGLWTFDACPYLRTMSPLIGDTSGETVVLIEGSLFIEHPTLQCSFGEGFVTATYLNNSVVQCTTPPGSGEVEVNLWVNGAPYTSESLRFNYIDGNIKDDSGPLLLIIIAVVALFVVALVGSAVIVGIMYRRQQQKRKKLVKPDLIALAFGNLNKKGLELTSEQESSFASLEKFILKEDMEFVSILCQVTASTEQDVMSKCLVYLFEYHDNALSLLSNAISTEVAASTQGTTFRANSMATKMFAAYAKVVGLEYVWSTLALIVHELQDFSSQTSGYETSGSSSQNKSLVHTSMEVDPNKVTEMDDIKSNILQLQLIAQKIFDAIVHSGPEVPLQFRLLAGHVKVAFQGKFDGAGNIAVGAFLFLRFFCPALTTPHTFGLLESPPTESCQRHLILVSKLLQNLSNGTMPGNKEGYMQKMNEWINDNKEAMNKFIDSISDPLTDEEMERIVPVTIPKHVKINCMVKLHKHICMVISKINGVLEEEGKTSMRYELASLLDQVGISPDEVKRDQV